LRSPGRRHHHATHLVRTQSVHRNGERQRRIDATGQTEDGTGKTVLAQVIGDTHLQCRIDLGFGRRRLGNAPGQQVAIGIVDHRQVFDKGGELVCQAPVAAKANDAPSNTSSS
jgi:hypothetical protein